MKKGYLMSKSRKAHESTPMHILPYRSKRERERQEETTEGKSIQISIFIIIIIGDLGFFQVTRHIKEIKGK